MKVLLTDSAHEVLQEKLRAAGHEVTVRLGDDYDTLLREVQQYDALVVRSKVEIDATFLQQARHLRCIGRLGAGMETIDTACAEGLGIACLNSPEGNRDAVGEHTTALLLSLFNKICLADAEVRQGVWQREENRGLEVMGKTVGIVGFGHMGAAFAQRLQGFGCRIIAYDKYKQGYAPAYVEEVSLEQLQREADVVSFHVPLTDETHYYFDDAFVHAMAKPFYLLNTSRGAVVQTAAVAKALQEGKLLGAALDVIEYENMTKDGLDLDTLPEDFRYLLQSPRMLFTPHVGGWTVESRYKLAAVLADKIIDALNR